jgi:hypothetical protein
MRRMSVMAAAVIGFGAIAVLAADPSGGHGADQPNPPTTPPATGSSSSDLERSGGVITPPSHVDPGMKRSPPPSGDKMPVVPPPGTPGGDPSVKPK